MPHYVLQLKEPRGTFGVYSTIVDNLITTPMQAEEMKAWLVEREYTSWLEKGGTPLHVLTEQYGEETGRSIHEMQRQSQHMYFWHDEFGFQYAREIDAYFNLPRSMWRCD